MRRENRARAAVVHSSPTYGTPAKEDGSLSAKARSQRTKPVTGRGALDDGWAALGEARWEDARASFEHALEEAETPEALEGLGWSAWWLDDAETTFAARERAYRLYTKRGDPGSAARLASWIAGDYLDFRGEHAIANGWLRRAHRLLDPLEESPDHGWLAFYEGYMAGTRTEAARLAAQAAEIGRRFRVPDLEMLGLALEGSALVALAQVDKGMRCLDEAVAAALSAEAHVLISIGWTCCFLISACLDVRDYERASQWCERVAEFASRWRSRYLHGICRIDYAAVYTWRGDWKGAEAELMAAAEDFARSRPALVGDALVGLANLRRRQGRMDEAKSLLERARGPSGAPLSRAALALDAGDQVNATELAERFLRGVPQESWLDRIAALELLVRTYAARGDLQRAASALTELQEIERVIGTRPLRAAVLLAEGIVAAAGQGYNRARPLFEDAVDLFSQCGAPFETAEARIELAGSLMALGRTDAARSEARAALDALRKLGAGPEAERARRLLEVSSPIGRRRVPLPELTRREIEVLGLVAQGLTNAQIGRRLVVSEHTVHRHVTNILRKLDLPSRSAAAAHAVHAGLFEAPLL